MQQMPAVYVLHILAGALGLALGYVALYSPKGGPLHRRAGMAFVYTMLPMCALAAVLAIVRGKAPALNTASALLTASLVITAMTTVRPPTPWSRRLDLAAMLTLFSIAGGSVPLAIAGFASGNRLRIAQAASLLVFGAIAFAAARGDWRVRRGGALNGPARLKRHLWRMSFALFVAAMAFFLGQSKVFPEPIRITGLLAIPVYSVLATMAWWLWRMRTRAKRPPRLVHAAPTSAATTS